MTVHVSSTVCSSSEVKIVLYSIWYHHTCRWPSCAQVERVLSQPVHRTATYRCEDTRCCIIQFWPPDDEYMVLETYRDINKLIIKQDFIQHLVSRTRGVSTFWNPHGMCRPSQRLRYVPPPLTHSFLYSPFPLFWTDNFKILITIHIA